MAHYAIGDVQGCRAALEDLLERIRFDPASDRLWFAGDLVARGPDSLGTLRLISGLGDRADSVLGNHDLHLIAAWHGLAPLKAKDGTAGILTASDGERLMRWLQQRPMLIELPQNHVLTHAGIPPGWDLSTARACARELETALRGPDLRDFLTDMYGNQPATWSPELRGTTRLRVITNIFTRMRLLDASLALDFSHKGDLASAPPGLRPWFDFANPALNDTRQIFGHWAALQGWTGSARHIAIDTGCVWGASLCAYRIEDGQRFHSRPGLK